MGAATDLAEGHRVGLPFPFPAAQAPGPSRRPDQRPFDDPGSLKFEAWFGRVAGVATDSAYG